jgi:hypothetical protein
VETLGRNEGFLAELVAVWVAEDDTGQRSAAGERVVDVFGSKGDGTYRPESWMISFTMPRM